jgi:hypothetical protein
VPHQLTHGAIDHDLCDFVTGLGPVENQRDQRSDIGLLRRRDPPDQVHRIRHAYGLQQRTPKIGGLATTVLATNERAESSHANAVAASFISE